MRIAAWIVFLAAAAARPGIDLVDRWLVASCWDVPSSWNAVADAAIRTGAVGGDVAGLPAPWRQASVLPLGQSRVAIVTVSDMATSRVSFITERYDLLGVLTRRTSDPALVTDEARGYKPLSHIWPIAEQDGRLLTLIAMAPLRSEPVRFGVFAYVALGARENELLFVGRLDPGPGPTWGELVRVDDDLVVFERGERANPPIATFTWEPGTRAFTGQATEQGRRLVKWWSPPAGSRATVPRDTPIDDAVRAAAARLASPGQ